MSSATDKTPLTGAQFARQVGADPEKWATRFIAADTEAEGLRTDADRLAFVAAWFRDAMAAAVKAAEPPIVDWDKLRDRLNVTLTEHGLPNMRKLSE